MISPPITNLSVDIWLQIGNYTFVDLSVLSRAMREIASQVFDQLKICYAGHPIISKFMPFPFAPVEASSRTIVYMTDQAIKRFGRKVVRDNFSPERFSLEALLRTLTKIQLSMQKAPPWLGAQIVKGACSDGDIPVVRGAVACDISMLDAELFEWQDRLRYARWHNSDQALISTFFEAYRDGLHQNQCVNAIGASLTHAADLRYPLIVNQCLATNLFGDFNQAREQAVVCAAKIGDLPQLEILLLAKISDECRGCALSAAAGNNHLAVVQVLRQNGPIPDNWMKILIAETTDESILAALNERLWRLG